MRFIRIFDIVFNVDHIITIEDDTDNKEHCIIRMTNKTRYFISLDKDEVKSRLDEV